VHQDANLDNLLVAEDDPTAVAAILDFGDAVRSTRVADLAVAASYLLPVEPGDPDAAAVLDAVVAGAAAVAPLTPAESGILPLLTAGRLAQRLVLGWWLTAAAPPNVDYVSRSLAITAHQLAAIGPLVRTHLDGE
jgi:Ser/Thr protein kinase RdoA (MazF antagonist)